MMINQQSKQHHGIVLDVSKNEFDQGSASFGSIFVDDDDPRTKLLFYSGALNGQMTKSGIGLATSKEGFLFHKESNEPVFRGDLGSFCHFQALVPIVMKVKHRFYMILSGKPSPNEPRRIGMAYADDPKGPWHIIGELIRPGQFWEGNGIDNGCSVARIDEETILVYYSSITSPKTCDVFTFLRRYPVRRIGILKIRIRGTSRSNIEAMRFSGNPLKHLNGQKGTWNESVFCPGYIKLNDLHLLFPATSTYSTGFPYKQYIGLATSKSPHFPRETLKVRKLIDGPLEKSKIMPGIQSEIALDTASPYLDAGKHRLHLYYSVADRANESWKIALTTFSTEGDQLDR
ncbi:MAG TPA: hypothetical protein VJ249_02870 [Candidatus Bathyarchaeia archaeon]|nr:hypothetical protein [Candidatus Bathyarchaeia archaeon]